MLKALLRLFINLIKMFYFIKLVRGDSIAVVGIYRKNGTFRNLEFPKLGIHNRGFTFIPDHFHQRMGHLSS